jgi:hypothetical protein
VTREAFGRNLMSKNTKPKKLRAQLVLDVPLREVSGICLRRGRNRKMALIAVGDRVAKVAWLRLPQRDLNSPEWQTIKLAAFSGSRFPRKHPQIEAICSDGAGRLLLLQETPPRIEVVDPEILAVVASIKLKVRGRDDLARSWSHPDGSRGEGMVLLPGGRLLIAKEKKPAALIEFGVRDSRSKGFGQDGALGAGKRWPIREGSHEFVALAVWYPDEKLAAACADFSDLEIGPDGHLYLLSDKSASVARIGHLPAGGGSASLTAFWKLSGVKGKPEGLSFTADGRAVVALDERKARRNLMLLKPAIAS